MKKLFLILSLVCLTLVSCSDVQNEPKLSEPIADNTTSISEETAMSIAASAIEGLGKTRSDLAVPEVQYVLRSEKTRTSNLPDTLAYVFNYPDNGGFAVISTDSRVEPLLAYSDEGRFDCQSDFVKENILRPIEGYFNANLANTRLGIGGDNSDDFNFGYEILEWMSPKLIIKINQVAPWNKVVEANKGKGYVAGCVPVAMAYIVSHCSDTFTLRGRTYDFKNIEKSIAIHQGVQGLEYTSYSYATAENEMAQLLWDLGLILGARYQYFEDENRGLTIAASQDAISALVDWGFESSIGELKDNFDIENTKGYINSDNIVYVSGCGHAWLIDGYQVKRIKMTNPLYAPTPTTYLHFQWGEEDELDGYYSGPVFVLDGGQYSINYYCPFKEKSL